VARTGRRGLLAVALVVPLVLIGGWLAWRQAAPSDVSSQGDTSAAENQVVAADPVSTAGPTSLPDNSAAVRDSSGASSAAVPPPGRGHPARGAGERVVSGRGAAPPPDAKGGRSPAPDSVVTPPETARVVVPDPPPPAIERPAVKEPERTPDSARATVNFPALKSEPELLAEAEQTVRVLVRSIGTRDTAQIRRAFPSAPREWLGQWQTLFEAASQVESTMLGVTSLGSPSAVSGSTARFRVRHRVAMRGGQVGAGRTSDSEFTVTLRRDANGWTVVNVGAP
jgi:hypothetical protein